MKPVTFVTIAVAVVVAICVGFVTQHGTADAGNPKSRKQATKSDKKQDTTTNEIPSKEKDHPKNRTTLFMRAKLANAQSVLEGLVTEDYKKIETGAQRMVVLSQAAGWQVVQGPVYAQDSSDFRKHARQLIKMAKEKNLEGVTLGYMQLTVTCVHCHQHVRGAKIVDVPKSRPSIAFHQSQSR